MKKGIVTFVILLAFAVQAGAVVVDSNSIVKDDIEYYFETDKTVYDLGETVDMLYRVRNIGDESVLFRFYNYPPSDRCDFMVHKDGERIWYNLRVVFPSTSSFTLSPSGSRSFNWSWDMTDLEGSPILPGTYDVTGVLSDLFLEYQDKYVPVSVEIQVVPEPATFLLLALGVAGIRTKRFKSKRL